MLVFAFEDHMQPAADKPHIHHAYDGLHLGGRWIRLNPDSAYAEYSPDNNANNQPANWNLIRFWGHTNTLADEAGLAAISEMADRTYANNWSNNLADAIVAYPAELTLGLLVNETNAYPGYTLFAPLSSTNTYLVDNDGKLIHSWTSQYSPGNVVYLLENGHLLRTGSVDTNTVFSGGGQGGIIEEIDWDDNVVWSYEYSSTNHLQHHDIEWLPNSNILMVAWEYRSTNELVEAGRDTSAIPPGGIWPDTVIEISPTGAVGGDIVWEWRMWDHLVQDFDPSKDNYGNVSNNPQLINLNFWSSPTMSDWVHMNAVDYNADLDQVAVSLHNMSEIWVIDHSTTTEEAASHSGGVHNVGGDLLYRWGNPQVYGTGTGADQVFFGQHDVQWIPGGYPGASNILVFNNGWDRGSTNHSSVDELVPPIDPGGSYSNVPGVPYDPTTLEWQYTATPITDFYSSHISGAHRLPNGNTFICEGAEGVLFEVTDSGDTVWRYVNPVNDAGPMTQGDEPSNNMVFRAYRYATNYPGLQGQDLTPGDPIELY